MQCTLSADILAASFTDVPLRPLSGSSIFSRRHSSFRSRSESPVMKPLLSLLFAPALALAGTFSGTVVSLDGTPVVGATIKVGTDSVKTNTDGSWTLARAAGIATHSRKTVSVTKHLTLENGHPRLSFGGVDASGRGLISQQTPSNPSGTSARTTATSDTLQLYWKGKRLMISPVSSTAPVAFRIDTAWSDDHGIPWTPTISYGSLVDKRDGQTYRTVKVPPSLYGAPTRTWMAENLNFKSDSSLNPYSNADSGKKYGRLYSWTDATQLPDSCNTKDCSALIKKDHQGICPEGWTLPSQEKFIDMTARVWNTPRFCANNNLALVKPMAFDGSGFHAIPKVPYYDPSSGKFSYYSHILFSSSTERLFSPNTGIPSMYALDFLLDENSSITSGVEAGDIYTETTYSIHSKTIKIPIRCVLADSTK